MRRWLAVLLTLTLGALGGCLSSHKDRNSARSSGPPLAGVIGDDVIYVDVAVIERTLGDAFLNHDLWTEADEEVVHVEDGPAVSLELKTELEKNGFRIGQIGGLLPSKLQDLLTSERSCQARRIQLHAGHETILSCGSPAANCRYRLVRDDRSAKHERDKARCEFVVVPSLAEEGRVRLHFRPCLSYGDVNQAYVPVRDAEGQLHWDRQEKQNEDTYPWLDWTLTVVANEYVVLGALVDNGDTLGEQFFLTREEGRPIVQRLLVLRATHVPMPAYEELGRSPPLALRAGRLTVRGRSE